MTTALTRRTGLGTLALIAGAVAIGFAPIFVRYSETGSTATAFWRMALAVPFMLAWTAFPKSSKPVVEVKGQWTLPLVAGILFGLDLALWHAAIHLTSVANATLEANLGVVFVPLLGWIFLGQKTSRSFVVAIAVSLCGTALLVAGDTGLALQDPRGDALGILAGLFYAGYLMTMKAARDRGIGTAKLMSATGLVSSLFLLVTSWITGDSLLPATFSGWLILGGLAFVSQVGGQSLITHALAALPASFVALGLLLQPATAAVAAWLLLDESLSAVRSTGAVILLCGIWLARRAGGR